MNISSFHRFLFPQLYEGYAEQSIYEMRTKFDIGQIIREHGEDFLSSHQVVTPVRKAFGHMAICRTKALGGHVEACPKCGEIKVICPDVSENNDFCII